METQPDFELQQQLQRLSTQFIDGVTQATDALERSPRARVRDEALRKNLRYVSSALEIAAGPFAGVNLLDMFAFVRISRAALERYWIPALYRDEGEGLREVFARAEEELDELAVRALSASQNAALREVVATWLDENPAQVRVEGVRLSDFSAQAGTAAAATVARAKGLLASVATAARTANQALLLSERALFLFHRLPFVWRLQARLAARELVRDGMTGVRRGLIVAGLLAGAGVCAWGIQRLARR